MSTLADVEGFHGVAAFSLPGVAFLDAGQTIL